MATDWAHMRSELEELLRKPTDTPQQKKDQQQSPQNKQDQNQDQSKDQQQSKDSPQQQGSQGQPQKPEEPRDQSRQQQNPEEAKQRQKAFGDMSATPTPAGAQRREKQEAMKKVGGVKKDQVDDPARKDPELAVPLEKLEQIRAEDSPAELFEMLRKGEPVPTPANTGKNW